MWHLFLVFVFKFSSAAAGFADFASFANQPSAVPAVPQPSPPAVQKPSILHLFLITDFINLN
jgi:hypothetical protein